MITDGPYAEGAEVAGGYYMFEADNLDEALQLARQIPAARYGGDRGMAGGPLDRRGGGRRQIRTGWRCCSSPPTR